MTRSGDFGISCVIQKTSSEYHIGDGSWDNNIGRACLYGIKQAEEKLKEMRRKHPGASILCVIQNKAFDYYDGRKFVYNLLEAKFYPHKDALEIVKKMSDRVNRRPPLRPKK